MILLKLISSFTVILFSFSSFTQELSYEELRNYCRYEGSKWRGLREIVGECAQNKEINRGCIDASNSSTSNQNRLQTCECLMRNSDFYQDHRRAYEFREMRSQEARDFMAEHGSIAKLERTREMFRELCYPARAIELIGDCENGRCDKYYAIYVYQEGNSGQEPECMLRSTSHNWAQVGQQKFYFPGALNITKLFSFNQATPSAIDGYNGPLNPSHFDGRDNVDGDLNCYGSLTQVIEEQEILAQEAIREGSVNNADRSEGANGLIQSTRNPSIPGQSNSLNGQTERAGRN